WAAAATGLLQSTGLLKGMAGPAAVLDLHNYLASLSLYAATVHAVVLLWDRYVPFTVPAILVPFSSDYKPLLVGMGSLAFYMALGVTVTTYFQAQFRPHTWRRIHQTSLVAYLLVLIHGLVLGTDTEWFAVRVLYAVTATSMAVLAAYRFLRGKRQHAR
ncbi:MAG TPA: ferric reductase-like transmembrane domain-containing protein, partial [Symbiobacteriaceae bacterium]